MASFFWYVISVWFLFNQRYGGIIWLQNAGTCLLCYVASYCEDCNVIFTALGTSNLTTNSQPFIEPAGLLLCSHEPTTCPYPGIAGSNSMPSTLILSVASSVLSVHFCFGLLAVCSLWICWQNCVCIFYLHATYPCLSYLYLIILVQSSGGYSLGRSSLFCPSCYFLSYSTTCTQHAVPKDTQIYLRMCEVYHLFRYRSLTILV